MQSLMMAILAIFVTEVSLASSQFSFKDMSVGRQIMKRLESEFQKQETVLFSKFLGAKVQGCEYKASGHQSKYSKSIALCLLPHFIESLFEGGLSSYVVVYLRFDREPWIAQDIPPFGNSIKLSWKPKHTIQVTWWDRLSLGHSLADKIDFFLKHWNEGQIVLDASHRPIPLEWVGPRDYSDYFEYGLNHKQKILVQKIDINTNEILNGQSYWCPAGKRLSEMTSGVCGMIRLYNSQSKFPIMRFAFEADTQNKDEIPLAFEVLQ